MKHVLAICGSLRAKSANLTILEDIKENFSDKINVEIYKGLENLPQFNPDKDDENVSEKVADLRKKIRDANGVLICSPEYVFSIPGVLKNALEWTVSSADFYKKPTALITASSLGEKAHESLFLVLKTIDAKISEETTLLISHAQTKLSEGKIADDQTRRSLNLLIESFLHTIDE